MVNESVSFVNNLNALESTYIYIYNYMSATTSSDS